MHNILSRWRAESGTLGRYASVGLANTILGFAVIFGLTWMGVRPLLANVAGYAAGFVSGYVLSRAWVFRTSSAPGREGTRYALAFAIAFVANLLALQVAIAAFGVPALAAQVLATLVYSAGMYALSRWFVFRTHEA